MVAGTNTSFERMPRRPSRLAFGVVALALAVAVPATALAGKSNSVASISLSTVSSGAFAATAPKLGDYVTFTTIVPKNINNPRVEVLCWQSGQLTFGMAGATDYQFLLGGGGSMWKDQGGEADCVANLYYFSWKGGTTIATVVATTSFHAGG